ncbi:Thioesterase superfamily protein [Nitrococcus mobilis Nb-231]|uniref:Thioesterase superfamily protein n=2 Tax=Nitrococcus mobilis TaxID=35797 RepID=A4BPE8_9GAMM|nr:Thioesterase superfamily protein [Nitrococcus mobilis Nb-231]
MTDSKASYHTCTLTAKRKGTAIMSGTRALLGEIELKVRWGDMDALGHVNNAVYFTYFEQIRVAWLERLSMTIGVSAHSGPVIVTACCAFHRPIIYPARLLVRMFGANVGRSSFETFYEIHDAQRPDTQHASGSAKVVWVNHREGRSIPLPAELRQLLPGPTR